MLQEEPFISVILRLSKYVCLTTKVRPQVVAGWSRSQAVTSSRDGCVMHPTWKSAHPRAFLNHLVTSAGSLSKPPHPPLIKLSVPTLKPVNTVSSCHVSQEMNSVQSAQVAELQYNGDE